MADASGAPRRVSMAYILGFSNKPFRDGGPPAPPQLPPTRHSNAFKQMASNPCLLVTTPGGVIEWAASDGRRGRLIGPRKPQLTAANLAQVPEGKASVKAVSKKDAAEDEGGMAMFGLFDDGPAAPAQSEVAKGDKPADIDWTEEQDKKLMDMKGENKSWNDIAGEVGKNVGECRERFKNIKPQSWQPNNTKKSNKQNGSQDQDQEENKDGEKKDDNADQGFKADENAWFGGDNNDWNVTNATGDGGFQDNSGGNNGWGNNDGNGERQDGSNNGLRSGADLNGGDNQGTDNNNRLGDGGGGSGDKGATKGRDSGGGEGGGGGGGEGNPWTSGNNATWDNSGDNAATEVKTSKSSSNKGSSNKDTKPPSNKTKSLSGSKRGSTRKSEKPSASAPTEYELKPDSTFSADDLRLIARILQQDCQMVWNRVSWRFKDKTGRNLHPEMFEKKITGRIEERGSERDRRLTRKSS